MGLWAQEGTGGTDLLSVTARCSPCRDGRRLVREFCMAIHCMCCRPAWLPPLGCSANVLVPYHSFRRVETLERLANSLATKKAAVCSTKQTKTKRSSLTTREGFQQTTTSHTFTLPADSLVDDSVHTKPSTVLPHETVTSQTSLSLGLDSDQEVRGGSRSPTLPAPRGREALPRCSVAHFYPPSECDIPGDW